MLKRMRADHPLAYCVLAVVLFLAVMLAGTQLFSLAVVLAGPAVTAPFAAEPYLLQVVQELLGAAAAAGLLALTGRLGVIARRGRGFLDGLLVGMFPFVLSGYSLSFTLGLIGPPEGAALKPAWRIASFFLAMLLIGVAEELIFRGVVAQTLLEHYGPGRAGVWRACVLSGLCFGAGHAVNLMSSAPLGVLVQCCLTAALGMLYTAIYYRTGNLWVLVFLHTLQDASAMLMSGLYEGGETISEAVSGYDLTMLAGALFYLLPVFFLLRKKRLPEVAAFWGLDSPAGG